MNSPSNLQKLLGKVMSSIEEMQDKDEDVSYDSKELIENIGKLNEVGQIVQESYSNFMDSLRKISEYAKLASHHIVKEAESNPEFSGKFSSSIVKDNSKEIKKLQESLDSIIDDLKEVASNAMSITDGIGKALDRYYLIN